VNSIENSELSGSSSFMGLGGDEGLPFLVFLVPFKDIKGLLFLDDRVVRPVGVDLDARLGVLGVRIGVLGVRLGVLGVLLGVLGVLLGVAFPGVLLGVLGVRLGVSFLGVRLGVAFLGV
jgi:hypothetical protein